MQTHPLPDLAALQEKYEQDHSNENLKQLVLASLAYSFTPLGLSKDLSFFEQLPYNARAHDFAAHYFDQTYHYKWIPDTLPTLIFAGEHDHITPLELFKTNKAFDCSTIVIETIKGAGHYPWIENRDSVQKLFEEFFRRL